MLIATNVVIAVALIAVGSAFGYAKWRLGQINRDTIAGLVGIGHGAQSHSDGSSTPPFTLLVIGSDTRNLGTNAFGTQAEAPGQRSDSILLVRVVPKTRTLALLSIPRDTIVAVPGYGKTRINTAFNNGPALLVQVLSQDFGIQVNHVAQFNFDTFEAIDNALGGVYQWFPAPARDINSNLFIPKAGCILLTGGQALAFARSREYQYYLNGEWHYQLYPESDLARIQRQQAFAKAAVKKAESVAPTNPFALNGLISGLTKNVTLDSGFSDSLLLSLALDFRHADLGSIPSFTYATVNSKSVPGALDPDTAAGAAQIQQWLAVGQTPTTPSTAPAAAAPTTTAAPPTTLISPASVSVEVVNGSGVAGQAGTAGASLRQLGYSATVTNSATAGYGHAHTIIEYAPDSRQDATQMQSQLSGGATLVESSALGPSAYNLELITGSDFTGVIGVRGSNSQTASTTSTTSIASATTASPAYSGTTAISPDSSSTYNGVYVPPGRTASEPPLSCPL